LSSLNSIRTQVTESQGRVDHLGAEGDVASWKKMCVVRREHEVKKTVELNGNSKI
jgi:hypothetical protein